MHIDIIQWELAIVWSRFYTVHFYGQNKKLLHILGTSLCGNCQFQENTCGKGSKFQFKIWLKCK